MNPPTQSETQRRAARATVPGEAVAAEPREAEGRGWAGLYDAHRHAVYNAAYQLLGERTAAEDVLQEVFLALVRTGVAPRSPRAWLLAATLNRVRDRARRRRPGQPAAFEAMPGAEPEPVASAVCSERAAAVAAALAQLPLAQREVVVLHAFEGLSFQGIGELCGTAADTAASRWRYACDKLRRWLRACDDEEQRA